MAGPPVNPTVDQQDCGQVPAELFQAQNILCIMEVDIKCLAKKTEGIEKQE